MDLTGIIFPKPLALLPHEMMTLISGSEYIGAAPVSESLAFPPKSVEIILELLEQQNWNDISVIEWIFFFESDEPWLTTDNDKLNKIAVSVLQAIVKSPTVLNLAIFRAALALESSKNKFPAILLNNLRLVLDYIKSDADKLRIDFVLKAKDQRFLEIVLLTMEHQLTPAQFLNKISLAKCTYLYTEICNNISEVFKRFDVLEDAGWLINCLYEVNHQCKLSIVTKMLNSVGDLKRSQEIIDWLKENCDPSLDKTLWFELEPEAKKILGDLITIDDFVYVKQLSQILTSDAVAEILNIEEIVLKQIRARESFWSHYKESFLSVTVYVPKQTFELLQSLKLGTDWLKLLSGDDEASEIIVFELGKFIIVEFLRGGSSEIRLYPNNQRHSNLFLRNENLSSAQITQLYEIEVHDHVFLWQWACERWLRLNFQIVPDSGTKRFRGLPPSANQYSKSTGLPTPDDNLLKNRAEQLDIWSNTFFAQEAKNKHLSVKDYEIYESKRRAAQYKSVEDYAAMVKQLEIASKLGDIDAIKALANWLLTRPNGTKPERLKGETLYRAIEIYEGKFQIADKTINVWQNISRDNLLQEIINIPVRRLDDGYVGVEYKSIIYELYLIDKDHLAIFLDTRQFDPNQYPASRSNVHISGLKVRIA